MRASAPEVPISSRSADIFETRSITSVKRIAIVGGGIAGLSAAFYLEQARRQGASVSYQLFEAGPRLGGILHTVRIGEFVVEAGADSFLTEKPWAHELCCELGLESELIGSNDAARQTYVLINGNLVPLPKGMQFIVPATPQAMTSELFSTAAQQQIAREVDLAPRASNADESVAAFVERHFGREVLERVADPMLSGIYGGETERLSARAVLPRFVEMERSTGSLIRALQAAAESPKPERTGSIFTSFRTGMQRLVDALQRQLEAECVHLNCAIRSISQQSGSWSLGGAEIFDALILAVPAWAAARLLADYRELAGLLGRINYTSSMTVALGYEPAALRRVRAFHTELPRGFGFLVPRSEGKRLLACTFVHNKFSPRVPEGGYLVRLFFGGARHEAALRLADDETVSLARRELKSTTGFNAVPTFNRVWRWPLAMPQYDVGHLDLVEQIKALQAKLPGLALAGNAYHGVGIPDCIRGGREAAERFL